jgi:hypothetical protein
MTLVMVPRRKSFAWIALASVLTVAWLTACSNHNQRDLPVAASNPEWQQDSTLYEQRLAKWLRDSTVIDSIARTIPTDSLRRAYMEMLTSERPEVLLQQAFCLEAALSDKYGRRPANLAARRVEDSVFAEAGTSARRALSARFPKSGLLSTSRCGPSNSSARAPEFLNGTPLRTESPKPLLPKRRKRG